MLPLAFWRGYTAITRYLPLGFTVFFLVLVAILYKVPADESDVHAIFAFLSDPSMLCLLCLVAGLTVVVLYALSCFLSIRLYKTREL